MSQLSSLAEVVAAMEKVDPASIQQVAERLRSALNNDHVSGMANHTSGTILKPHTAPTLPTLLSTAGHMQYVPSAIMPGHQVHAAPSHQTHGGGRQQAPSEAELKRQKRLLRNRISAKLWRNKKRARMEELENTVTHMARIHSEIARQVHLLVSQNKALRSLVDSWSDSDLRRHADEIETKFSVDVRGLSMLLAATLAFSSPATDDGSQSEEQSPMETGGVIETNSRDSSGLYSLAVQHTSTTSTLSVPGGSGAASAAEASPAPAHASGNGIGNGNGFRGLAHLAALAQSTSQQQCGPSMATIQAGSTVPPGNHRTSDGTEVQQRGA